MWAKDYIKKESILNLHFDEEEQKEDFDIFGKIFEIVPLDQYSNEIKLKDFQGNFWTATISKKKFSHIWELDVARFRSVKSKDQVLELAPHSNILKFVKFSKLYSILNKI